MVDTNKVSMAFAAIEKTIESSIPSLKENEARGKNYVEWGENNAIPNYLYDLYTSVTTLRTVINGTTDFIVGDGVSMNLERFGKEVNKQGDTIEDLVSLLGRDYLLYGNCFVQVIRDKAGNIAELYYLNAKYMRSSKKNDLFYYSEDYGKQYMRSSKVVVYPKFVQEAISIPASVFMLKSERDKTYGLPQYVASLKDCEIDRNLSEFNLSQLENGFFGSYIFNFQNGIPSDEQKAEIERSINDKFCSSSNAGRILLNFCDSKDNSMEVQKLDIENYADKYNTTADRARNKIYEAFRANKVLFGIDKETTGFNDEDYMQAFKLYNRVCVLPIQKKIKTMFEKIFGVDNAIEIKPFTIDWSDDDNNEANTVE